MFRKSLLAVPFCVLVALTLPISLTGIGVDSKAESTASVSISGLFPNFDPAESRYVSRCGRGALPIQIDAASGTTVAIGARAPTSGAVRVDSPAPPGADFPIAVTAGQDRRTYRVRCLPADFPTWSFQARRRLAPGFFTVSFTDPKSSHPWVIVFDDRGVPRWWYTGDTRVLWAQVLADGTVSMARSFGDGYGLDPRMAQEIHSLSGRLLAAVRTQGSITDGHEFQETGDGNFLMDTYDPAGHVSLRRFGGPARGSAVFAEVQEVDPEGQVLWRWNSRREISLRETGRWWHNVLSNGKRDGAGVEVFDPVHINSIEPRGQDEVVVSMRHTDAVYGIERSSGNIAWKLGGTKTADSLRVIGDPAQKLFGGQHDARVAGNGVISIFDNGKDRPRRPRVAFYRLDLDAGTATFLGQLNDPRVSSSHCCGSARPLEGGWLVSWGDNPIVSGFDGSDRLAFRLELPTSTYRAVPVPAGAVSEADLDRGLEKMESEIPR